jgi:hypothetical protein
MPPSALSHVTTIGHKLNDLYYNYKLENKKVSHGTPQPPDNSDQIPTLLYFANKWLTQLRTTEARPTTIISIRMTEDTE